MFQNTLKKLFGTHSGRAIKKLDPFVADINRIYDSIQSKSDEELVERTREFQAELSEIESSLRSSLEGKPAEVRTVVEGCGA
jgi:preprotein translocase subunit SecA